MPGPTAGARVAGGWFTSSYSNEGNGCVQVRFDGDSVLIADSKQRGRGPVIRVSGPTWDAFVAQVVDTADDRSPAALSVTHAPANGRTLTGADGTTLHFTAQEWTAFVAGAADREFGHSHPATAS